MYRSPVESYGIKLIYPAHLEFPHLMDDFDGTVGKFILMNCANHGPGLKDAMQIPVGHCALLYVTDPYQCWIGAIEYTGPLDKGNVLGQAHGLPPRYHKEFPFWRKIRFVARMRVTYHDCSRAPTRRQIIDKSGIPWEPEPGGQVPISPGIYTKIYHAITWDWELPN